MKTDGDVATIALSKPAKSLERKSCIKSGKGTEIAFAGMGDCVWVDLIFWHQVTFKP